jgi:hypothetical protein
MRAVMLSLVLVLVPAVGCSAAGNSLFSSTSGSGGSGTGASGTGTNGTGANGTGGTGTGTSGTGGGLGLGGAITGSGGGSGSDCTTASELIYVFDTNYNIWSFNPALAMATPQQNPFALITTANCPGFTEANSMAVDRNVVAWLNYQDGDGAIFTLDLKTPNAACTPSGITLPSGFNQVGMGFSTDVAGGTTETLYLDGISGAGLAKVDMSTMAVTLIGNFSNDPTLESQSAELTGTGNALLYGYFVDSDSNDVYVAGIDKTDSKILSSYKLPGVMAPSDWAFSFWGGDFYLYASDGVNDSNVIQYDPTTKTVNQSFIADVGMWPQTMGMMIIGAGSTTCAPIMPPM